MHDINYGSFSPIISLSTDKFSEHCRTRRSHLHSHLSWHDVEKKSIIFFILKDKSTESGQCLVIECWIDKERVKHINFKAGNSYQQHFNLSIINGPNRVSRYDPSEKLYLMFFNLWNFCWLCLQCKCSEILISNVIGCCVHSKRNSCREGEILNFVRVVAVNLLFFN